ncbi:MAG: D-alanyl-D-alanine carboxypeptidase [Rhodobacteraceae bacterium]|nr:D-alanyl-D-alanine carboxypeptidase [Paracoccaceae bacterium]
MLLFARSRAIYDLARGSEKVSDVATLIERSVRLFGFVAVLLTLTTYSVHAAPYAAMVMDARSGEVLHSRNADTRLHPASLTKMMTLYVAFEAVENGEITLDTMVRVSKKAAAEPPSKLGLKAGSRIKLRYLLRAAAVKSGNDAATAIAEAISGSEAAFTRRMNRTAKSMGMTKTTFKNAHGLTQEGHLSTARDMTILGRHVFYDYPEYYNLFSRRSTHAGIKTVNNTNRRLLNAYRGADGIKTGYTRAAGYNLVASAERGQERIIATVFGGKSGATRNARVAELLDMGFSRAPSRVAVRKPARPAYQPNGGGSITKTVRVVRAVAVSPRPMARPAIPLPTDVLVAMAEEIEETLAEVAAEPVEVAAVQDTPDALEIRAQPIATVRVAAAPRPRPNKVILASAPTDTRADGPEIVTRMSTSGGRHWSINVGSYGSRYQAERILLQTALVELATLDEALRKVVPRNGSFDANFVGFSEEEAALACRRLAARNVSCQPVGPG